MGRFGRAWLLSVAPIAAVLLDPGTAHARAALRVRLVPPLEGADVVTAGVERDGTRLLISRGIRVALGSEGELALSDELLPVEKSVVSVELPVRFGGGYLFASSTAGRTTLWKARTWTGKLAAFADIDFDVARIVPGFDRIHIQARRSGEWAALDPVEGRGLDRGGLPASASYGAMAFADSWFGAVELPVRGTVVSFDAGASWHPLGFDVTSIGVESSAGAGLLALGGERGMQLLGSDGRLRPAPPRSARANPEKGEPERVAREGAFGRLPLRTALLRGVPQPDGTALVLSRGALGKIRLEDGRVLAQRARAVAETMECSGVRVGKGYGFVCGEPRGKTEIYELSPPLGLELRARFDGPRQVFPSDNGGLVVSGSCSGAGSSEVRCIITPKSEKFELSVAKYGGLARVVALSDGRAAVIVPPAGKAEASPGRDRTAGPRQHGSLELIDANGRSRSLPLKLDIDGEAAAAALESGFWMQGLVEAPSGMLSGWVVSRGSFLGVRLGLDGKLSAGPLARSVESALFSGRSALVMGASGIAEQSADGGFNWTDAVIASSVEGDSERPESTALELEQGCSAVGCVFRRWLRVGWDSDASVRPLMPAPRAEPTVLPSPGGGRWQLACYATGNASRPALPLVARRGYGTAADVPSPWLPLLDVAAPALPKDHSGLDVGTESELIQLRAYVEGSSAAFAKDGSFVVRVADRYRVANTVWSTLPSPSPWPDFDQALDAFGFEGGSPSGFRAALDASGSAGVLSVNWRGTTDLYLLEQDRPIRRIENTPRYGFGAVTSAVRVGTTFYVATAVDARTLRVFALDAAEPRLVGEYRDVPLGSSSPPLLVRSSGAGARRGLGLWTRGAGWYVFPIDERSGLAAPPIEINARTLSSVPRTCSEDEEGFLLEGSIGLEPIVELSGAADPRAGNAAPAAARGMEGRFIVSAQGVCVRELAALADRPVHSNLARAVPLAKSAPIPLVLSDRGERGRRYEFRCASSK